MANIYQRKSLRRKIVYTAAILILFTGSIVYRKRILEPTALRLQLREQSHGEVELSGAALRQLLFGGRAFATTWLWWTVIDKQKKHEFNEVELLVSSITKLQPYFLMPWMFQSWNLAFNVSVECDRPKDKYYYISRGISLLAEGERRNQGRADLNLPGHPELRHTMALYYLYKIGLSDEKTTMKCLLDLSTIDPLRRHPDWFRKVDPETRRRIVDKAELKKFCQDYPRLVRRLREGLDHTSEESIVEFLDKNGDVPSRFVDVDKSQWSPQPPADRGQTNLKVPSAQFPILPPHDKSDMPDRTQYDMTNESFDVFLAAKAWSEYAFEPLPEPMFGDQEREYVKHDRSKRLPKMMALIIFRSYVARCQAYIAENLEEEGWFDDDGWLITNWFNDDEGSEFRVGQQAKYYAQPSWERAADLYYRYGVANDLMPFTPEFAAELDREAAPFRKAYGVKPGESAELRSDDKTRLEKSWEAHMRPIWQRLNLGMTNFEGNYHDAVAERSPTTVTAKKLFYQAERARRFEQDPEKAMELYQQAWPFWIDTLLRNPVFARDSLVQEDAYEYQLRHLRLEQTQRADVFRAVTTFAARLSGPLHPSYDPLLSPSERTRITLIRNLRGILDWYQVLDVPDDRVLLTRQFITVWPIAPLGFPAILQSPTVTSRALTREVSRSAPLPHGWRYLTDESTAQSTRDRLGVNKRK
ncbi:MAG TPA: hypothetical protein VHR72_10185 [Gemmataceae bacterium]|jgi:hypothetical protein|nr:hypothetical protein [Gemmataceae bacterium]